MVKMNYRFRNLNIMLFVSALVVILNVGLTNAQQRAAVSPSVDCDMVKNEIDSLKTQMGRISESRILIIEKDIRDIESIIKKQEKVQSNVMAKLETIESKLVDIDKNVDKAREWANFAEKQKYDVENTSGKTSDYYREVKEGLEQFNRIEKELNDLYKRIDGNSRIAEYFFDHAKDLAKNASDEAKQARQDARTSVDEVKEERRGFSEEVRVLNSEIKNQTDKFQEKNEAFYKESADTRNTVNDRIEKGKSDIKDLIMGVVTDSTTKMTLAMTLFSLVIMIAFNITRRRDNTPISNVVTTANTGDERCEITSHEAQTNRLSESNAIPNGTNLATNEKPKDD